MGGCVVGRGADAVVVEDIRLTPCEYMAYG